MCSSAPFYAAPSSFCRLAESNLQPICREVLTLYETEGRRQVADAVAAGLLAAVAEGPRATEQFAAVVAVFVGGMAATARAQDISASFLEMLVARLEQVGIGGQGTNCWQRVGACNWTLVESYVVALVQGGDCSLGGGQGAHSLLCPTVKAYFLSTCALHIPWLHCDLLLAALGDA